ncbi:MAG: hypothetical protein H7Z75_13670 [Ferruginibacter sp.]|nr:hypothetical protein [Cytophagales bacterium]
MKRIKQVFSWLVTWLTPKRSQDAKVVSLCLLAATTFWFLNALNRDYSTRISCAIRFNYDDSTYMATKPLPDKVRLSVTGYGWNLLKKTLSLDTEPIEYTISKPMRTKYVTAPFLLTAVSEQLQGLRINYVVEDTLHLDFDRRVRKTVDVRVDSARVNLDKEYVISGPITVNPTRITFEGPASVLDATDRTLTISLPATRIDEDYDETLDVSLPGQGLVSADAERVTVRFGVERLLADSREVPVQEVHYPGSSPAFGPTVRVTYSVRKTDAPRVAPGDFNVVADFKNLRVEDSTIVLFIEKVPPYIRNVRLNSPSIRVGNDR